MHYILNGKTPVPVTMLEAAFWEAEGRESGNNRSRVALYADEDVSISTVFLVIDHNWLSVGDPVLFETLVNTPGIDELVFRYTSYDAAKWFHDRIVQAVKEGHKITEVDFNGLQSVADYFHDWFPMQNMEVDWHMFPLTKQDDVLR